MSTPSTNNKTRTPGYARPPLLVGVGKEGRTDRQTDRQTDKAFCRPTPWVWQKYILKYILPISAKHWCKIPVSKDSILLLVTLRILLRAIPSTVGSESIHSYCQLMYIVY